MSVALPYFYPRPPRGGRRAVHLFLKLFCIFLSTPSARRATYQPGERRNARGFLSTPSARRATESRERSDRGHPISIHALREEGDASAFLLFWRVRNFYPRPPRGGRLGGLMQVLDEHIFLSTPSARRATCCRSSPCSAVGNFYPRPPRGGRRFRDLRDYAVRNISIHALREEGDFQFHKSPTH